VSPDQNAESVRHDVADVYLDADGWLWFDCECGQQFGPFPGRGEANDEMVDHRAQIDGSGADR